MCSLDKYLVENYVDSDDEIEEPEDPSEDAKPFHQFPIRKHLSVKRDDNDNPFVKVKFFVSLEIAPYDFTRKKDNVVGSNCIFECKGCLKFGLHVNCTALKVKETKKGRPTYHLIKWPDPEDHHW